MGATLASRYLFVTLFHEGASGFEKWRATLIETEELKKCTQSRSMGLHKIRTSCSTA